MNKILKSIWKFINSKIFGYILILAFAVLFLGTCNKNNDLKNESSKKDQNISALIDSVQTIHLKNGVLEVSINGFLATSKELKEFNLNLSNQLKKERGKVITYSNIIFELNQNYTDLQKTFDSLKAEFNKPIQTNDSTWNVTWTLPFMYDSLNYDIFEGTTVVGVRASEIDLKSISLVHNWTFMNNRNSSMSMTWGQKYENGKLKVFARTLHPAFSAKLLEGTYVDYPKEKHWFSGFGIGPTFNIGYDFLHNQPAVVVGIGINYNIYQF